MDLSIFLAWLSDTLLIFDGHHPTKILTEVILSDTSPGRIA